MISKIRTRFIELSYLEDTAAIREFEKIVLDLSNFCFQQFEYVVKDHNTLNIPFITESHLSSWMSEIKFNLDCEVETAMLEEISDRAAIIRIGKYVDEVYEKFKGKILLQITSQLSREDVHNNKDLLKTLRGKIEYKDSLNFFVDTKSYSVEILNELLDKIEDFKGLDYYIELLTKIQTEYRIEKQLKSELSDKAITLNNHIENNEIIENLDHNNFELPPEVDKYSLDVIEPIITSFKETYEATRVYSSVALKKKTVAALFQGLRAMGYFQKKFYNSIMMGLIKYYFSINCGCDLYLGANAKGGTKDVLIRGKHDDYVMIIPEPGMPTFKIPKNKTENIVQL